MTQARPPWGTTLVRERVRGYEPLVYSERAHSLLDVLDLSLRWGDREFVVDDRVRLSYAAHRVAVRRFAQRLVEEGVRPGDRILLLAANAPEWIVAFWAVLQVGGVVVLGNGWWSRAEVGHALTVASPTLALVDEKRQASLAGSLRTVRLDDLTPLLESGPELDPAPPSIGVAASEDDPAIVLFTSGTSGQAKGAVLSHRSVLANQHNFLAITGRLPSQIGDDYAGVRVLVSAPLFHTGGVQSIMSGMLTGTTMILAPGRFDPARVLERIESERVSAWSGVPTAVQRVIEHPDALTRDLSSVRSIGMGGAPLPGVLIERASAAFPNLTGGVSTNYGMTEAGGIMASASGPQVKRRPGTSGKVLPAVELRIDRSGADHDVSDTGEIIVRSAALMTGYWGESASPIDADGWLRTGDVGRLDEDGYLYVVDRVKDIIIRAGENIASTHVEAVLLKHPDLAAVAVVGLPDQDLGERVGAVVLARPGAELSIEELREYAAERLAHFEVPSLWWIRTSEFPTTATQKIDKRRLRAEWPVS